MRGATRITTQTGQVQVPSASPDDRQIVYLSDNGGHSNLWVVNTDGTDATSDHVRRGSACLHRRAHLGPCRKSHRVRSGTLGTRSSYGSSSPTGAACARSSARAGIPAGRNDGRWLYYNDAHSPNQIHKIEIDTEPRCTCEMMVALRRWPANDLSCTYLSTVTVEHVDRGATSRFAALTRKTARRRFLPVSSAREFGR